MQRSYDALFESEYDNTVDRLEFQTGRPFDAEDIASRAFERLWVLLERGTDVGDLRARLNLIAEGLVINHWRDQERRPEETAGLAADMEAIAGARPLPASLLTFSDDFDTAVRALPDAERDALILTDLRGLTVREAAAVLDTSKNSVARRRLAAHTFLRKELS